MVDESRDGALVEPYLTEEHGEFRRGVRSTLATLVVPHADTWEEQGHIPRTLWQRLGESGLLGIGHTGPDFLRSAIFLEELGRTGYSGVRAAIGVHAYMASSYLELFGTDQQKESYLRAAREGRLIAALAISEPGAGSDLRHLATIAKPHGSGGYSISGEKVYVTNGSTADFLVVLARTGRQPAHKVLSGVSLFLIDAHSRGIDRYPQPMLGWRSADIARVQFADVEVQEDRVLGRVNQALIHIMKALDFERLVAGLLALGGAGFCLDLLHKFVTEHHVGDRPLSANAAVRQEIAELDGEYHLIRQYAYHVAWLQSKGGLDTRSAAILKLKSTELAVAASHKCVRYQGAQGYLAESAAARIYRDAVAGTIAGGPSELMREMIFELG